MVCSPQSEEDSVVFCGAPGIAKALDRTCQEKFWHHRSNWDTASNGESHMESLSSRSDLTQPSKLTAFGQAFVTKVHGHLVCGITSRLRRMLTHSRNSSQRKGTCLAELANVAFLKL